MSTEYEKQLAKERDESRKRSEELVTTGHILCQLLPGFSIDHERAERWKDAYEVSRYVYLRDQGGRVLSISLYKEHTGKREWRYSVRIAQWPKTDYGYEVSPRNWIARNQPHPEEHISVDVARGPEQLAKDIKRRLLPGYYEFWTKMQEQADQRSAMRARQKETARVLSEALGQAPKEYTDTELRSYDWQPVIYGGPYLLDGVHYKAQVYTNSRVSMEITATPEQAEAITRIIRGELQPVAPSQNATGSQSQVNAGSQTKPARVKAPKPQQFGLDLDPEKPQQFAMF